jgi:hypothetical protein
MNSKAQLGDAVFLGWRILIIAMVLIFVTLVLSPIFSAKHDMRQNEAIFLADKIIDCISKEGIVKTDFSLDDCAILDKNEYYINVSINSFDSSLKNESTFGNSLEVACALAERYTNPPSCIKSRYYVLIDNDGKIEKGSLDMLVGIRKINENVE